MQAGPEEFYFENGKLPKLLMTVEKGITIEIFEVGIISVILKTNNLTMRENHWSI